MPDSRSIVPSGPDLAPASAATRLRELWPVVAFTAAYLALAGLGAVLQGNLEFLIYLGVMALLIPFVWAVDRHARLSAGVIWGLSLWGALHMAGGLIPAPAGWPVSGQPVLYSVWLLEEQLKYDQVVHALGFGVTTWACWQGLRAGLARRGAATEPTWGLMLLCAAAGMGFGALNEVAEFAATLAVPETNVGGYANTGWDLVANLVGSVAAVVAIRVGAGRGAPPPA